jgi:hypothetical protein
MKGGQRTLGRDAKWSAFWAGPNSRFDHYSRLRSPRIPYQRYSGEYGGRGWRHRGGWWLTSGSRRHYRGAIGLGLEAQRKVIEDFAPSRCAEVLARFTEVESGRMADRPELLKALHLAKVT